MSGGDFRAPQPGLFLGIMAAPADPLPSRSLQICLPLWASPTLFPASRAQALSFGEKLGEAVSVSYGHTGNVSETFKERR